MFHELPISIASSFSKQADFRDYLRLKQNKSMSMSMQQRQSS